MAWAFWGPHLWGEGSFDRSRAAGVSHPRRLRKDGTDLFDWIAELLRELLHPHPKLLADTG